MKNFIFIEEEKSGKTYLINVNQITWLDINTRAVELASGMLFYINEQSMGDLITKMKGENE